MFIYLDTETTGNGPDDRLCQIAFKPENGQAVCELFNPGRPISIDAMAIHHITEKMVADKPSFMGSEACGKLRELVSDEKNVIVAHNAQFDMTMLHWEGIFSTWTICTLEIPSDQQGKIDSFMKTGKGLDDIQLHPQIDCPEYRHLFNILRKSDGPIPVAIDLLYSWHGGTISRDEWMARSFLVVLNRNPSAKILLIVGSLHTLKKLEWKDQVPNKHLSIREYITRDRHSTKMWSIGQMSAILSESLAPCLVLWLWIWTTGIEAGRWA